MKVQVFFETKNSVSEKLVKRMQYNDVKITITYFDKQCVLQVNGEQEKAIRVMRLIWELLFLYDGYFYRPQTYIQDGREVLVEKLYFLNYYKTDKNWYSVAAPLHEGERPLSGKALKKYDDFRNTSRNSGKLIKALLNSFYYLHSEAYEQININHRLSLLLNICDGYIINMIGQTNNVEANIKNVLGENLDVKLVKYGAELLGIPKGKIYKALALERNEIDHYIYKNGSLTDYVYNRNDKGADYVNWYFTYVIELALRIGFLNQIGYKCPKERMIYALSDINDWVILACELPVSCANPCNKSKQDLKKMGITIW